MVRYYTDKDEAGNKYYYKDPKKTIRHRTDGPAVERWSGTKVWYANNIIHRMDGPAVEYQDGIGWWYINGVIIFETNSVGVLAYRQS